MVPVDERAARDVSQPALVEADAVDPRDTLEKPDPGLQDAQRNEERPERVPDRLVPSELARLKQEMGAGSQEASKAASAQ